MGRIVYTDGSSDNKSLNIMGEAGNIIAAERNTGSFFYNKDMRGSTTTILDGAGNAKVSYEYTDFGETTAKGDFYNEICYTGGIYDKTTGLYYLNARYYYPDDGRFVTQDTYRGDMNNPSSLHLYAYCANNPANYVDPSGHRRVNLTYKLDTLMHKNLRTFLDKCEKTGTFSLIKYFVKKVKTGGDWDLKSKRAWKFKKGNTYYYKNYKLRSDDPGNIHFGFVGTVLFNIEFLCAGAGLYQIVSGTSSIKYYKTYGDDPQDQRMIRYGHKRYVKWSRSNFDNIVNRLPKLNRGIKIKKR